MPLPYYYYSMVLSVLHDPFSHLGKAEGHCRKQGAAADPSVPIPFGEGRDPETHLLPVPLLTLTK